MYLTTFNSIQIHQVGLSTMILSIGANAVSFRWYHVRLIPKFFGIIACINYIICFGTCCVL